MASTWTPANPDPGPAVTLLFTGRMSPDKGGHHSVRVARRAGWPLVITAKIREPAERAYFDQAAARAR
jgi:hypothetical protein